MAVNRVRRASGCGGVGVPGGGVGLAGPVAGEWLGSVREPGAGQRGPGDGCRLGASGIATVRGFSSGGSVGSWG